MAKNSPASPASRDEVAQATACTLAMEMPIRLAVRWSVATARMAMPNRL